MSPCGLNGILGFADSLLAEGECYRAITEYKRAIYILPIDRPALRAHAFVGVGRAYFRGGDLYRASDWLTTHLEEYRTGELSTEGQSLLFRALIRGGELDKAAALAQKLTTPESDFYSGVALAYGRHWIEAKHTLAALNADHPYYEAAHFNLGILDQAAADSYRSPPLAGVLATIPGLGYLYAGHPQSALAAAFMNSLLLVGAVQSFRSEQYALGGITSFLSLTWYAGSIYGSVNAARRFNDREVEKHLLRLRE